MRKTLLIVACCLFQSCLFAQLRQPFFYQIYADHGLSSDKTTRVIQDYQGFIWVGTEEGLNRLVDYERYDIHKFDRSDSTTISNNYITTLYEDSKQRLWVGTMDGLNLFNRTTESFDRVHLRHDRHPDQGIKIFDISQDDEGNLWVICNDHLIEIDINSLEQKQVLHAESEDGKRLNLIRVTTFESRLRVGTSKGIYTLVKGSLQKSELAGDAAVTSLLAVDNELWTGTASQGVLRYNAITGELKRYNHNKGQGKISSNHVNDVTLIDEQAIWVSTIDGISIIDLETDEVQMINYDFENAFSISDKMLRNVYQDRAGILWITTPNSGVNYYHKADNLFGYYGQSTKDGTAHDLMDYAVFAISGSAGKTWLGSRKGISSFEGGRFRHYPFKGVQVQQINGVYSIAEEANDHLWLGTNKGVLYWNNSKKSYQPLLPDQLGDLVVNTTVLDHAGNLWMGTETSGIKVYNTITRHLREVSMVKEEGGGSYSPSVRSVLTISGQRLLAGTSRGLYLIEDDQARLLSMKEFEANLPDNVPVNTILQTDDGNIWVGSQEDGLLVFDRQMKPLFNINKKSGITSNDIRSVVQDHTGTLWVSTNAGLSKLSKQADGKFDIKNYDIQDGLQSNHFSARSGIRLEDGRILLGGLSGLTIFHPDDIVNFSINQNPTFVSLSINGEKVKVGEEDSPLSGSISLMQQVKLKPRQNNFTIEFRALDYMRPLDIVYRYKLKNYDNDWITKPGGQSATYQKLKGGNYEFVFQSKGRFSDWSTEKALLIEVQPYYYQTVWFKLLVIVAVAGFLGFVIWYRATSILRKKKELELLVDERSAELREEVLIRRQTEKKLTEALIQAEQASEIKSRFLANMSHEVRTPLNGIMGMTELSLDTDLDSEQRDILQTVYKSANSLRGIVNDVLDIAKIEAGELQIANEKFSVRKLLDETMASFKVEAVRKQLSVKHWILPKVPNAVFGDAGRLRQILVNLIGNAMKFTHSGGITVIVEAMNQRATSLELWFTVTDTGIGIPEYQLQNIFENFMQLDSGPSRVYGGTGLGLSISKELVEKMGGEIWVESEEGKGSIFSFYIKVEEYISDEVVQDGEPLTETAGDNKTGQVLLVEDIPTNQKVAIKILESRGVSVTCVDNGREALNILKKVPFDLVLMDLQMPEIDGYETTRLIRTSDLPFSKVPIVALTAAAMEGEKEKCLAAGMNGYLSKPYSSKELISIVSPYLKPREEESTPSI